MYRFLKTWAPASAFSVLSGETPPTSLFSLSCALSFPSSDAPSTSSPYTFSWALTLFTVVSFSMVWDGSCTTAFSGSSPAASTFSSVWGVFSCTFSFFSSSAMMNEVFAA